MATHNRPLKLLVVAMTDSVHTARWLAQIVDQGWEIHLFSSSTSGHAHPALRRVTVHHRLSYWPSRLGIRQKGFPVPSRRLAQAGENLAQKAFPAHAARRLAALIEDLRPDVLHSLEIQHAGYLVLDARRRTRSAFPPWLVTNWGNDIYHFCKFPEHDARIREVLAACDAYSCECERDVVLAREMGLRAPALAVAPNTGGLDLAAIRPLRSSPPSRRRLIMLKGYQTWSGRALCALRALERCRDLLPGYRVCVYSATPEVARAAEEFARRTGVPVEVLPLGAEVTHAQMLRRHGEARTSIGLSISDGVSTSFLEAFVMGSFPIQSWTSCANEWVEDGLTGLLVPAEDEDATEEAIRIALTSDELVDAAAERNWAVTTERLDARVLATRAVAWYRDLADRRTPQ
jgi:hypothetical protein